MCYIVKYLVLLSINKWAKYINKKEEQVLGLITIII